MSLVQTLWNGWHCNFASTLHERWCLEQMNWYLSCWQKCGEIVEMLKILSTLWQRTPLLGCMRLADIRGGKYKSLCSVKLLSLVQISVLTYYLVILCFWMSLFQSHIINKVSRLLFSSVPYGKLWCFQSPVWGAHMKKAKKKFPSFTYWTLVAEILILVACLIDSSIFHCSDDFLVLCAVAPGGYTESDLMLLHCL